MKIKILLTSFLFPFLMLSLSLPAYAKDIEPEKIFEMNIDELMNITITSASKREETLFGAASAIHVITQEDIRRSGATSIPEVLRLATGMEVARINANQYAISARGQNEMFSSKLLVLIDGRAVYTPDFSGVWWAAQNYPLEEIDRVEVIKGPGTTLWGSNAVNGVINIITKRADQSQGAMVSAGTGTEERGFGTLRYGGSAGEDLFYRFYGMGSDRDGGVTGNGRNTNDDRQLYQAGFRADWSVNETNHFTFQGDMYDIGADAEGEIFVEPEAPLANYENTNNYSGGNILLRHELNFSDSLKLTTKFYYDLAKIDSNFFGQDMSTYDGELQLDSNPFKRHKISTGAHYKYAKNSFASTNALQMNDEDLHLYSLFVQDEVMLIENRLKLILGSKFEKNIYTDWEFMPNIRVAWTDEQWTLWGAISRAARLSNQTENDMSLNLLSDPSIPAVVRFIGDERGRGSEKMTAYETGLRVRPAPNIVFDLALYYNAYDNILTSTEGTAFLENSSYLVIPMYIDYALEGETYGLDLTTNWKVSSWLRLSTGYTFTKSNFRPKPGFDTNDMRQMASFFEGTSPRNRFTAHAYIDLPYNLEFDTALYYKDELSGVDGAKSFTRLDLRIGWKPIDNLELSLTGMNLLDEKHLEYESSFMESNSWIERSVYGKVTYKF